MTASLLDSLQTATATAADKVGPAVVRIGRGHGRGAGIVVAPGVVATNAHNLRGAQTTITFADGRVATGTVAGIDADGDLATVTVDTAGAVAPEWSPQPPALGQPVFALAVPPGGGLRVTQGAVSATARQFRGPGGRLIDNAVEHTAPLAPGSSGGPVVDGDGRLLAISTHRLGEGFYLAVPASAELRARLDGLSRGESPTRRRLGVALAPAHVARRIRAAAGLPDRAGLLVRGVEDRSPAAAAGLTRGDLLVSAAGTPVASTDDLAAALDALTGAEPSLTLGVVRGADDLEVVVTFSAADAPGEGGPPDA
jgi:serine protease Do